MYQLSAKGIRNLGESIQNDNKHAHLLGTYIFGTWAKEISLVCLKRKIIAHMCLQVFPLRGIKNVHLIFR